MNSNRFHTSYLCWVYECHSRIRQEYYFWTLFSSKRNFEFLQNCAFCSLNSASDVHEKGRVVRFGVPSFHEPLISVAPTFGELGNGKTSFLVKPHFTEKRLYIEFFRVVHAWQQKRYTLCGVSISLDLRFPLVNLLRENDENPGSANFGRLYLRALWTAFNNFWCFGKP